MNKVLLLIDFENLYMRSLHGEDIKLTEKGLEFLLDEMEKKHGEIDYDRVLVAAIWDNFKEEKMFFNTKGIEVIETIGKGKNIADGFLILKGYDFLLDKKDQFDTVILIGGDGVYVDLVSRFMKKRKNVVVYGWKDGINTTLEDFDKRSNFSLHTLNDFFDCGKDFEKALENSYFSHIAQPDEKEKEIIRTIAHFEKHWKKIWLFLVVERFTKKDDDLWKKFPNLREKTEAKNFMFECIDKGIFTKKKEYNEKFKKEVYTIKLNRSSEKVKIALKK